MTSTRLARGMCRKREIHRGPSAPARGAEAAAGRYHRTAGGAS